MGQNAPVFWYSPTSFKAEDYMFWHTAWFNGVDAESSDLRKSLDPNQAEVALSAWQDGPLTINLGDVYKTGNNHVEQVASSAAMPMPAG